MTDISDQYETKEHAPPCHTSEVRPCGPDAVFTPLTSARFQQFVESRDAKFGAQADVAIVEGVFVKQPVIHRDRLSEKQR